VKSEVLSPSALSVSPSSTVQIDRTAVSINQIR